jgi:dihydroorotate dehydrogenase
VSLNPWFLFAPETAHRIALSLLRLTGATAPGRGLIRAAFGAPEHDPVTLWGHRFRNRVGLAAGWDKDGLGMLGLSGLGLGHLEIGTVTPRPQPGNPRPRVFRLVKDEAIINRMGFPGRGANFVATRIEAFRKTIGTATERPIIGVNIGRNKDTPNERAAEDYISLLQRFSGLADYLVINVSSPNTAGLRDLQARNALEGLLSQLIAARASLRMQRPVPVVLKISPDLGPEGIEDAVGAAVDAGIDGIIAANTTLSRPSLVGAQAAETGGLSGRPLGPLADSVLAAVVANVVGRLPVIASGGVMTSLDVQRKLDLGASLVQVWSGLVYGGPGWPRRVIRQLAARTTL